MIIIDDDGVIHKVLPIDTLDKIRAEIMDFCKRSNITCDSNISACLDIIDKYREEQE